MNTYGFIDSIQVEKANALATYKRFDNISKMLTLIEVFVAVALISWSSTRLPTVFKASGEYLFAYSSYVMNQHVVFLVGNVIVVLCYILSGHTDVGNETPGPEVSEDTVSNIETVKLSSLSSSALIEQLPEEKKLATATEEIHVRNEDANVKIQSEMVAETVIKQATKQIERFQRTQSVKLRREMSMKPRGELRRSVSERRRSVVTEGDGCSTPSSFETVERLSNEEFRLAVEAFISKQQRILKQQTMVEESYYL